MLQAAVHSTVTLQLNATRLPRRNQTTAAGYVVATLEPLTANLLSVPVSETISYSTAAMRSISTRKSGRISFASIVVLTYDTQYALGKEKCEITYQHRMTHR